MADTIWEFDLTIDLHGARIIRAKDFIGNACQSDDAVDLEIKDIKDALDAVSARMKEAIRKQSLHGISREDDNA